VLEPILLRAAARRPEARVVTGAACVAVEERGDAVVARIRRDDGTEQQVEAAWVIAADGASSPTRRAVGIPMQGIGPLGRFSMVHFAADLQPWIRGRSGPIFWILNPEAPGAVIVHDPERSHVFMLQGSGAASDAREDETIPARLAAALAVPVTPEILSVDSWSPHVQVAARYRHGRVFLVGDAAHRFPPTGGLGLNTGIAEADVLCRLLGRVEAGRAPASLLDAYEPACRPVAQANADASFENMKRLGEISEVIGPASDLAALEARAVSFSQTERRQLEKAIESQREHFGWDGRLPEQPAMHVA
jgi:2,4-dichlorophenol 6-monooxygenase